MEGKPKLTCPLNFFQVGGNKNISWRDFSVFEKMFSLHFDSKCCSVQCVFFNQHTVIKRRRYSHFLQDVYSYVYYGHFMFLLRLFRMDMNVTR